jgi:hypothetical protein
MARNSKSKDSAGALGFVLLLLVATLLVFLAMFYGVIVFIASFNFRRNLARLPVATSNRLFVPTREEARAIADADERLKQEKLDLQTLKSQGRGLTKRNDGAFDERNSAGKDLNENLRLCKAEIADLQSSLQELRAYRSERFHHYVNAVVKARSWNQATLAYVVALIGFMVVTPQWVVGLAGFLSRNSWVGPIASVPLLWGVMTAAAMVSVAVLGLGLMVRPHFVRSGLNKAPAPEETAAITFTERYAAMTGIGNCDPSDSGKSQAVDKAPAAVLNEMDSVAVAKLAPALPVGQILVHKELVAAPINKQVAVTTIVKPPLAIDLGLQVVTPTLAAAVQVPRPTILVMPATQPSASKPAQAVTPSKPAKKWNVPALWKRLSFAVLGGLLGTITMIFVIGGTQLPVWIAAPLGLGSPIVGLIMGFQYYKFFNKPIKE